MRFLKMAFLSLLLVALDVCPKHEFQTVALQHQGKGKVLKWDTSCLQQDTRDAPAFSSSIPFLTSACLAWGSWSLQMCPHQMNFISTVDQLIPAPFEDGRVEMRHELSEQQARDANWHFRVQNLCSVASAWHEFLGHCSPVAVVGCAACMSEAWV